MANLGMLKTNASSFAVDGPMARFPFNHHGLGKLDYERNILLEKGVGNSAIVAPVLIV
jgi:hypothetical protein